MLLVIVRDFDEVGVAITPSKTDPPLVINANAVLSLAFAAKPFQSVARKHTENSKIIRRVEHIELPKSRALDGAKLPAGLAMKKPLSLIAAERFDHCFTL